MPPPPQGHSTSPARKRGSVECGQGLPHLGPGRPQGIHREREQALERRHRLRIVGLDPVGPSRRSLNWLAFWGRTGTLPHRGARSYSRCLSSRAQAFSGVWILGALALVSATQALAQTASAPSLFASARQQADRLDFQEAVRLARAALKAGDAGPEDVWQLHAFLGEKLAALGENEAAAKAFGCALELHPKFSLPPDASPRLKAPFQSAQQRLGARRLSTHVRTLIDSPGAVQTRLSVEDDAQGLVSGARIYIRRADRLSPQGLERAPSGFQTVWQCGEPAGCHYYLALLDSDGNEALHVGSAVAPLSVANLPERPVSAAHAHNFAASRVPPMAWAMGAVGAGAIAGGVYFWIRGRGERADLYATCGTTGQCSPGAVQSARSKLVIGDVGVGVGLAAVVAAVWWGVTASSPRTVVGGMPVPGGAIASCTVAF